MPDRAPGRRGLKRSFRLEDASLERARDEVEEELRHHLELSAQELVDAGWSPAEAEDEARRRFGDVGFTTDYCARQTHRARAREGTTMWFDEIIQDVRFSLRQLRRTPTYTVVVVLTLAAAIAANSTIFSLMNPYLFRPLPFGDSEALVQIGGNDPVEGYDGGRFSGPQIVDMMERSRAFDELGFYHYGSANLTGGERAERRTVGYMSGNLFRILDASPLMGRYIVEEDVVPGGGNVVVISEAVWEERFARDPAVLGTTLEMDGRPFTVVGVMPAAFNFPFGSVQLWTPTTHDPATADRGTMGVLPIGRLGEGWTRETVQTELEGILAELASRYPDADGRYDGVSVKGLREALNFAWGPLRLAFALLLGAVGFVLVIACVNVASLTMARSGGRTREVAVRAAIGAGRGRLVRQMITEGFLLAALGGLLGVGLAAAASTLLNGILPPDLHRSGDVTLDWRVLAFSAAVTMATPFLFGLAPALKLARTPLNAALKAGGGSGTGRGTVRARQALVVAEVSLAIVLATGTGLMIRSLQQALQLDVGFDSGSLTTAVVSPDASTYPGAPELATYFSEAKRRVRMLPEVEAVGTVSRLPLNHETSSVRYQSTASGVTDWDDWPSALTSHADGDYFDAASIELRAGRSFTSDDAEAGNVVIVSESLARRLFPEGDAVGQSLQWGSTRDTYEATIVGVVGDVLYEDLTSPVRPHLYRPLEGTGTRRRFLVVRSSGSPAALVAPVRGALRELDPQLAADIQPVRNIVRESTLLWSLSSVFLGIFGLVALLLAALGIYGIMAFTVSQRSRELGLRLALGAAGSEIRTQVIAGGMKLTAIGLAVGLAVVVAGAGALRGVLFGISALDPPTLGGVALLFGLVAVVAAALPAHRASRTDPLEVLRSD